MMLKKMNVTELFKLHFDWFLNPQVANSVAKLPKTQTFSTIYLFHFDVT